MKAIRASAFLIAFSAAPFAAIADDDGEHRHRRQGIEYKHEYRDGNCKVERKREKNGDFEEKIDCKGGYYGEHGRRQARSEFKEEFRDGNCRVKRELQKDGDYQEERKCRGHQHAHARGPVYVVSQPVVVVTPPAVVVEPGVTIRGTIHMK